MRSKSCSAILTTSPSFDELVKEDEEEEDEKDSSRNEAENQDKLPDVKTVVAQIEKIRRQVSQDSVNERGSPNEDKKNIMTSNEDEKNIMTWNEDEKNMVTLNEECKDKQQEACVKELNEVIEPKRMKEEEYESSRMSPLKVNNHFPCIHTYIYIINVYT